MSLSSGQRSVIRIRCSKVIGTCHNVTLSSPPKCYTSRVPYRDLLQHLDGKVPRRAQPGSIVYVRRRYKYPCLARGFGLSTRDQTPPSPKEYSDNHRNDSNQHEGVEKSKPGLMSSKRHSHDTKEPHGHSAQSDRHSMSASRYLRPEDAYTESNVGYFGTSHTSHSSSRHSGEPAYSNHSGMMSTGYTQTAYTQAPDPFGQYQYYGDSQNMSSVGSPYSNRRTTPVDEYGAHSRHSPYSDTHQRVSPSDRSQDDRSSGAHDKSKGKQKEVDQPNSNRKQEGSSRHHSGSSAGGKRRGGSSSEKLVHGVFIRY